MNIVIFGGSFDPVHAEHIAIAQAAKRQLAADKIVVVPAFVPPHKREKNMAPAEDRLAMAKLAFAGVEGAEVSAYEISAGGTSYTVRTLRHFRERFPQDELFFLVGADMLRDFYTWKQPEEILSLAQLVACGREGDPADFRAEGKRFFARFGRRFQVLSYTGKQVSSTDIRVQIAFGQEPAELPAAVFDYIEGRQLYRVGRVREALRGLKPARREHSLRVGLMAAESAARCGVSETDAILAAGMHDCAKYLDLSSPELQGFTPPAGVPAPVMHQYTGAYYAEHAFGVSDAAVLDAIRYHTSGKPEMSALGKLIFLADMLESGRDFSGIHKLRRAFYKEDSLDECMYQSLRAELRHLKQGGGDIYPLTEQAYRYYKDIRRKQ